MKSKFTLLVLSLLASALAVPPLASAGAPEIDAKVLPLAFTVKGTHNEMRPASGPPITCTSSEGTGRYTTKTTGELTLTLRGCREKIFGSECHSAGQASGVIKTETSVFHNIYVTDAKTTPGVLFTPPVGGVLTVISCLDEITISGNGFIGHLVSPKCGVSSKAFTLNFTATGVTQNFRQITGTGTVYNLTATTSGSSTTSYAEVADRTISFLEEITLTCV